MLARFTDRITHLRLYGEIKKDMYPTPYFTNHIFFIQGRKASNFIELQSDL